MPVTLQIMGAALEAEPDRSSSVIVAAQGHWYADINGSGPALLAQVAARELRALSEEIAEGAGGRLVRARWIVTRDSAAITQVGQGDDCASCRAGLDQALAFLAEHPDGELAAGTLWWVTG